MKNVEVSARKMLDHVENILTINADLGPKSIFLSACRHYQTNQEINKLKELANERNKC